MLRKKESETKALKIVEEMIADNIEREIFREAVSYSITWSMIPNTVLIYDSNSFEIVTLKMSFFI